MTQPNTAVTWAIGSSQTVTWNVANTSVPPVSCANVKISLSVDAGNTFPIILVASTPNDGSETITVPSSLTSLARIKVEAVGNVFFDISNVNLSITGGNSSLSIDDATVAGTGTPTPATFTVSLSSASASTVTVAFQTADGTATAGSDYVPASGVLTFASGETRKTIAVSVNGDALGEASETFFVNLSNPTNATISDGQGVGRITRDTCAVSASAVADGGFEAGSPWPAWTVQGSTQRGTPICQRNGSCGFAIEPFAGEYVAKLGGLQGAETSTLGQSITIPASISVTLRFRMRVRQITGTRTETMTVSVDGAPVRTFIEPAVFDADYVLREVDLTPFANGASHAILFTHTNALPTNNFATFLVDNVELFACPPTGVVNACLADGTFEAGTPWPAWTVQSSVEFGTPICNAACGTGTAPFSGSNWTWFGGVAAPEQSTLGQNVTLPASSNPVLTFQMLVHQVSAPATDTLVVSVDGTPAQTFVEPSAPEVDYSRRFVDLTPFADGGSHALLFSYNGPTSGLANFLVDNVELLCPLPRPSLSINDVTVIEGHSPGTVTARFTVTLSGASTHTVTVAYADAANTAAASLDYFPASGTLTFPPGTTSRTLDVVVRGDARDELDESFFVNLSSPTNASIADGQGVATIGDDDLPPTISISNGTTTESSSANFSVSLSAVSGLPVTVTYTTVDGTAVAASDYTTTSGVLTFPAGVTTRLVTVPVSADTTGEPDEVFFVNLGSPVNATILDGQGVGLIENPVSLRFYTLQPCRLVDTRNPPGPSGGPRLAANTTRDFPVTGLCNLPDGAKAVAVNLTATAATEPGNLRIYAAGEAEPLASAINFVANRARANNAIVRLGALEGVPARRSISVRCDMPPESTGGAHFVLDVFGYFK